MPLWSVDKNGRCLCGKISCGSVGKHPHSKLAPKGFKNATIDEAIITKWCTNGEAINIGIATGKKSHLVVLDIDPKNGGDKSFEDLEAKYGKLDTLEVTTGSGGKHLYFSYPNMAGFVQC